MKHGFKVVNIIMDVQFEWIRGELATLRIHLKICSNNEHVGEI